VHRTSDELLDLTVITHVGAAEESAAPELFDLRRRCLRGFLVDLGKADIGALACEVSAISLPIPRPAPLTSTT
jgi:hypothetical protein